jgi:CheY-like chemotaxis protein
MENKKVILIVDDEIDMRIFLSTLAKVEGYTPVVAENGKEGLLKMQEVKPDLLILDIMMPGEDGIQMYRKIRSNDDLKHTPIVMLSAVAKKTFYHYLSMLNMRMGETIAEPIAYLEKPPDAGELITLINSVLGKNEV